MTDSEFDAALADLSRRQLSQAFALGRLSARVDSLRDDARMLRLMAEVERDIAEASCHN